MKIKLPRAVARIWHLACPKRSVNPILDILHKPLVAPSEKPVDHMLCEHYLHYRISFCDRYKAYNKKFAIVFSVIFHVACRDNI